ncbi:hypothetical protein LYSHEL_26940 [Lysobacter helvus]|uniref:Uncharacterized protein n=2 Tax=Lysobacteraceae TaxID=32033 RepID=A0ABM7Q8F4_9GAMM|nr:hypothetical protein LYSCAS_26910 [Lysobacter caseinilyticus]BCT96823.1 hypothetical protein LYSHEL_26940 [Lysobacter helvus]
MTSSAGTSSILSTDSLEAVRRHLDSVGFISVLHWHLGGASHPTPLAFSDFDTFHGYLCERARPGDAIDVWPFPTDYDHRLAQGKVPDADGNIHAGGAY